MKIYLLKKREDFLKIFETSIRNFLKAKYPGNNYVNNKYIINDHLNIIYPSKINRTKLVGLVNEYKYHPKTYRKILQTFYAFLAIRWPLDIIVFSKKIIVPTPLIAKENWVFIPGNHSIRIIDTEKNCCVVFMKSGFDKKFFDSDTKVRLKYPWLKSPQIICKKTSWYEEERVSGLPLDRLSLFNYKKKIISDAQKQLLKLYKKTLKSVKVKGYVISICSKILSMLETSLVQLSHKYKKIISNFIKNSQVIIINSYPKKTIDLVLSHGDFQPANIISSENDFWIIDWEYSNYRSVFYDALVFELECRFPLGLSKRFEINLRKLDNKSKYLNWTGRSLNYDKRYYYLIFFLEDLFLRMDEVSTNLIENKSNSLSTYVNELEKIQKILIKSI